MFHTKRVDEEYALAEQDLEDFLLRKTLTLHDNSEQIGEVLVFAHKYLPEMMVLQAEFYRMPLSSDVFFEKGLMHREHAFKPLQTTSLQGIVLSKSSGIILPTVENHFLAREEDFSAILNGIFYQEQHREEFADYIAVGSSGTGFGGYDYQPVGKELKEKIFLRKGKEADTITKETLKNQENEKDEDCVYNGEVFLRKKKFDGFSVTVGRTSFILQRERQGVYLRNQQISCLRKVIEIY